ncbi:MAG: recombinase family protein [Aquamicrobium sp.]|uniref:recombinase family protein n=1 Tax=Aquamicrobium sp. TaxID=1872579 RepID=UPI00349E7644|nr:recombinase family protein [Aquamicrobium sp.]
MGRKIGYLRVSTAEQNPDRQVDGLKDFCDELHVETLSAVTRKRPVYEKVVKALEPGDVLVIWDLDRAYRSAKDALSELDALTQRGVHFHIAKLAIDTATPVGRFLYTVMGGLAEFERLTLSQRTKEGLLAARRRGARLGRPPKLDAGQVAAARVRLSAGETIRGVACSLRVAPDTVTRSLRRGTTPAIA